MHAIVDILLAAFHAREMSPALTPRTPFEVGIWLPTSRVASRLFYVAILDTHGIVDDRRYPSSGAPCSGDEPSFDTPDLSRGHGWLRGRLRGVEDYFRCEWNHRFPSGGLPCSGDEPSSDTPDAIRRRCWLRRKLLGVKDHFRYASKHRIPSGGLPCSEDGPGSGTLDNCARSHGKRRHSRCKSDSDTSHIRNDSTHSLLRLAGVWPLLVPRHGPAELQEYAGMA